MHLSIVAVFFLFCSHLAAMDLVESNVDSQEAIELSALNLDFCLKDGLELLEQAKLKPINYCIVGIISLCSLISLILPGALPGSFLAGIFCDPYNVTTQQNLGFYPVPAMCIVGLAIVSLPAPILLLATIIPFAGFAIYNWRVAHANRAIDNLIEEFQESLGDENDNRCLTLSELIDIAPFLFKADQKYLKKLNLRQALLMASLNSKKFSQLLENNIFSDDTAVMANKYFHLISMDQPELCDSLQNAEVRKIIVERPDFFEGLVCGLKPALLENIQVKNALIFCLSSIMPAGKQDLDFNLMLNGIAQGWSINDIKTRDTIVLEGPQEGSKEVSINKDALLAISGYFANALNEQPKDEHPEKVILIMHPEAAKIMAGIALGEMPEINENNLLSLLEIAGHYLIDKLTEQCDEYIKKNGVSEQTILYWKNMQGLKDQDYFNIKFTFFCVFDLKRNKAHMVKKFNKELNGHILDRQFYEKITSLEKGIQGQLFAKFDKSLLNNQKNLKFLGEIACELDIKSLRNLVGEFVRDAENKILVSQCWIIVPPGLIAEEVATNEKAQDDNCI